MEIYKHISQFEPLLPLPLEEQLEELAIEIIRQSAGLGAMLHPITRLSLQDLFREMNSYYSNLIEGHNTKPIDIQKALKQDFSLIPSQRALQEESIAHIQVQKLIEQRIKNEPELEICSIDFLCWIHAEFYKRLPETFTIVAGENQLQETVIPGQLRKRLVQVGHHIPPEAESLPNFLERFEQVYEPKNLRTVMQVIAAACSHHRLAWIHPFLDGNGRVVRLFSHAYFMKINIDGHGLWTISRGLARHRTQYLSSLSNADSHRLGDLDGRGNLSQRELNHFCFFFLTTILDQINFISSMLEIDELEKRIAGYVNFLNSKGKIKSEAFLLLKEVLLKGEISRGEVTQILGISERSARSILKDTLNLNLLTSSSSKGPLRMGFPISAVEFYFPRLYIG